jgi:RimJ/RimL family protein N-acetyltransferase
MLYLLWLLIEAHGDWKKIFWGSKEPEATLGDLPFFVTFVHDNDDWKLWFMIVDNLTLGLIGAVWFDKFKGFEECEGGIWMARGHRHKSREVVHLATAEAFRQGYRQINVTSPHATVANLMNKCGYEELGQFEKVRFFRKVNPNAKTECADYQNAAG